MTKPYILVVEDEESLSLLIRYNLEKEGFEVNCVFDGASAVEAVEKKLPDLIVLDWMLPEMSGIEVSTEIRNLEYTKEIPIIMLTARSQEADRLKGFSVGVDDYITKPFSPKELVARIRSVLKRSKPNLMLEEVSYNGIKVDNAKKSIFVNNKKLDLSSLEYSFLSYLVSKPEKVHSRDMLLRNVWGDENTETRTVDVCVLRVRGEIQKVAPGLELTIKTVRGEGYILEK
jgi:two-component system, OmpR family, phosphate regulon response regulator PhoB